MCMDGNVTQFNDLKYPETENKINSSIIFVGFVIQRSQVATK